MTEAIESALAELRQALSKLTFYQAIYFEHAFDDEQGGHMQLSCPRFVIDAAGQLASWPQRWRPDLKATANWLRSDEPWTDDLEQVVETDFQDSGVKVADIAGVPQLREANIRSLLGVATYSSDRITASLIIGSTVPGCYGRRERDRLRAPAVTTAMRRLLDCLRRKRKEQVRKLREKFEPHLSPETLAVDIVTTLAEENDWDFVGIYRVENQFAMVASCDRTPGKTLKIDGAYRQDLDVGMLGQTLRLKKCLRADDVNTVPPPYDYSKVDGFEARSALCYPIIVAGRVEWILDCASVATAAFRGPDRKMLDDLIGSLQSTLDLWFEIRLTNAVLHGLTEPVLVIDRAGSITRANASACTLFGIGKGHLPFPLQELAFDEETRCKFAGPKALQNEDVMLRNASGLPSRMLVTSRLSSDTFGQYVAKFNSKGEREWLASLDVARQTVEQDAGEARALLMLGAALVDRVRSDLQQRRGLEHLDADLRRVVDVIAKADLSYEHLVGTMAGKPQTGGQPLAFETLVGWAVAGASAAAAAASDKDLGALSKGVITAFRTVAEHFVAARSGAAGAPGAAVLDVSRNGKGML